MKNKYIISVLARFIVNGAKFSLIILLVLVSFRTSAQIGIGTNIPDSSAALHIQDTTID